MKTGLTDVIESFRIVFRLFLSNVNLCQICFFYTHKIKLLCLQKGYFSTYLAAFQSGIKQHLPF